MAKILKDSEVADIISRAVNDPGEIDCSDSYRHFLEDLGALSVSYEEDYYYDDDDEDDAFSFFDFDEYDDEEFY